MAHGNDKLETDLRAIYSCKGYSSAMLALHGLCAKWGFDTSKLENAINSYDHRFCTCGRKLIDSQFPQWKHLEVKPVAHGGWEQ